MMRPLPTSSMFTQTPKASNSCEKSGVFSLIAQPRSSITSKTVRVVHISTMNNLVRILLSAPATRQDPYTLPVAPKGRAYIRNRSGLKETGDHTLTTHRDSEESDTASWRYAELKSKHLPRSFELTALHLPQSRIPINRAQSRTTNR
eukprot:6492074-Amphidinium_carterae.2